MIDEAISHAHLQYIKQIAHQYLASKKDEDAVYAREEQEVEE